MNSNESTGDDSGGWLRPVFLYVGIPAAALVGMWYFVRYQVHRSETPGVEARVAYREDCRERRDIESCAEWLDDHHSDCMERAET